MRRATVILLVLLIAAATGWAGGEQEQAGSATVQVTPPGQFPIVNERVTIEMLASQSPDVEDLNTNEFTLYYEDLTNVEVVFEQFPRAQQAERLNIVMASGDYPGVITGQGVFNRTQLLVYGTQGVFTPLNDLIDENMVHIKEMFEYNDYFRDTLVAPDGNIYGFPRVAETLHVTHSHKMWVYQPWMEALGLETPETTEEFRDMLVAFRDGDPNGNGQADEVPLAGAITGFNASAVNFLMNAFIYAEPTRLIADDGVISFVADQPEWRAGLEYIRGLYQEGLIAEESFTQDASQLRQLGENPNVPILGAFPAGALIATVVGGQSGRYTEYKTIPPIEGPAGVRQTVKTPFPVTIATVLTDEVEYPEVVVRWLDHFFTPLDGPLWAEYGLEGSGWERAEPGETGLDGRPAYWRPLRPWGQMQNIAWVHSVAFFNSEEKRNSQVASPNDQETILYNETVNNYLPYSKDLTVPPLFMTEEQALEMARIEANIVDYVNSSAARFIVGDLSIERDWETYLAELDRMGVDRYVEIYQSAYDAKYK